MIGSIVIYLCGSTWPMQAIGTVAQMANKETYKDIHMHQPYGCVHRRMDVCMEGMHGRFLP